MSMDAGLRVSVLNKNKKPKASKQDLTSSQRFGAAIVSTQRHNPASTVRPLPQALRPEEQQGGPNPYPLVARLPQVAPVTPATTTSNQGYQFAAPSPPQPAPDIGIRTLQRMQHRSLREAQVLRVAHHNVETGEIQNLPTAESLQARKRYRKLTMSNTEASLAFASNMEQFVPGADSQETCRVYDEMFYD
jgi:hypothetical protein